MKKKLIAGMTSAAVIASLSAPAFAANFTDTKGTASESATALLKALEVVNGDVNGNFNPNATITRAEFAKIAVRAAGLGKVADQYGTQVETGFNDVPKGHWAAGYVAIAKAQGLVKGYDQWNFGSADPVKYEDVLTVLERILGYNDNIAGGYSVGYVSNAVTLGVKLGAGFKVGEKATRGDVAIITQSILAQKLATYDATNNKFNVDLVKTLLSDKFSTVKTARVTLTYGAAGQTALKASQIQIGGTTYNVTANTNGFSGSWDSLMGKNVQYYADADNNLLYVGDLTGTNVASGVYSSFGAGTITYKDTAGTSITKSFVADAVYEFNGAVVSGATFQTNVQSTTPAPTVNLVLNSDGNVQYASASKFEGQEFVTATYSAVGTTLGGIATTVANGTASSHSVQNNAVITRNGAAATLADIQKGDVVQFALDGAGNVTVLNASTATKSGTLAGFQTGTNGKISTLTIDGVAYTASADFAGEATEGLDLATAQALVSKSVTVTLDAAGKVAKLASATATATSTQYLIQKSADNINVLNSDNSVTAKTQLVLLGADGKVVTKYAANNNAATFVAGDVYDYAFSSTTGDVDFTSSSTHSLPAKLNAHVLLTNDVNQAAKTVVGTDAGAVYNVTNSTVIYNAVDSDKTKWTVTDFSKVVAGNTIQVVVDPSNNANAVAIFVTSAASTSTALTQASGSFVGKYTVYGSTNTNYISLNVNGAVQNFAYTGADFASLTANPTVGDAVYLRDISQNGSYSALYKGVTVAGAAGSIAPYTAVANGVKIGATNLAYNSSTKVQFVKTSDGTNTVTVGNLSQFAAYINNAPSAVDATVQYTLSTTNVAGVPLIDTVVIYQ